MREAVEQAERIAGLNIEDVWVSFSAGGLVSDIVKLEVDLGGHRVEQTDIDELLAGRAQRDRSAAGGWCSTPSRRATRSTG